MTGGHRQLLTLSEKQTEENLINRRMYKQQIISPTPIPLPENHTLNTVLLTDFSETAGIALNYAISLTKITNGNLQLFHVIRPDLVTRSDNPILALQTINSHNEQIEARLQSMVRSIEAEGVRATYHFSIGNVNGEIARHLRLSEPDLVVIGKRKRRNRILELGGTTDHLINKYSGSLLIASQKREFRSDSTICVAGKMNILNKYGLGESNRQHYFKNAENLDDVRRLTEYISNRNIDLLCMDRGKRRNTISGWFFGRWPTATKAVQEIDIPILFTGTGMKLPTTGAPTQGNAGTS